MPAFRLRNCATRCPALPRFQHAKFALLLLVTFVLSAQGAAAEVFESEGLKLELAVKPASADLSQGKEKTQGKAKIVEGADVSVALRVTDAASGAPVGGLYPAAWIDRRRHSQEGVSCRQKVASFLQGVLAARPDVDLNAWYVLTLNSETPNISVIDPLVDFSGQKLLAMLPLQSQGEDWVLRSDHQRLYVTQPAAGKVALVDTRDWKVLEHIAVGERPMRIALQPDEGYVWVGLDTLDADSSGVVALRPDTGEIAGRFRTGIGHHEIAFSEDSRFVYVSNSRDKAVVVIDTHTMQPVGRIDTAAGVNDITYSAKSAVVTTVNARSGEVLFIDGTTHTKISALQLEPGLTFADTSPDGRWTALLNAERSELIVIDQASLQVRYRVPVGKSPDHLVFTSQNIHVYPRGSEKITSIPLATLGEDFAVLPTTQIVTGRLAPETSGTYSLAPATVVAPDERSILIANPADRAVYYYMEGMVAPMGSFAEMRAPRAVAYVNRSLTSPETGVYETFTKLPPAGEYDVAVMLDAPEVVHCFSLTVHPDAAAASKRAAQLRLDHLRNTAGAERIEVGSEITLQFRISEAGSDRPRSDLADVAVSVIRVPGSDQEILHAKPVGNGIYEVGVKFSKTGVYHVLAHSASGGLGITKARPREFMVTAK